MIMATINTFAVQHSRFLWLYFLAQYACDFALTRMARMASLGALQSVFISTATTILVFIVKITLSYFYS